MTKHELLCSKLEELKGILLLTSAGYIQILKGYEVKEEVHKNWLGRDKKLSYISKIQFNTGWEDNFKSTDVHKIVYVVDSIVSDRNRYLKLLSSLSKIGYTIKRK